MSRIPVETGRALPRRSFVKLCASAAVTVGVAPDVLSTASAAPLKNYDRVRLLDAAGEPLQAADLRTGESYVFNYPYATTPCFLLDLGHAAAAAVPLRTEDGAGYLWPGGVGPNLSVVSFSAICAHKMSHPAREVSFINYRHGAVSFRDHGKNLVQREGVIFCCSEKSVYDPARGADVLGGPARQPLCTILLEYAPTDDALYALGSYGGEMFEKFFHTFRTRLQLEWGISDVQAPVTGDTRVLSIEEYSRSQMLCGG